jgi:hypothetical protein
MCVQFISTCIHGISVTPTGISIFSKDDFASISAIIGFGVPRGLSDNFVR